jgi:hypothetical protein
VVFYSFYSHFISDRGAERMQGKGRVPYYIFKFRLLIFHALLLWECFVSGSTDMAVRMFGAIRTESDSVKPTVQEALSSLAAAYKVFTNLH